MVENATGTIVENGSDIYLDVLCFRGHRLPDGRTHQRINCTSRQWDEDIYTKCSRMHFVSDSVKSTPRSNLIALISYIVTALHNKNRHTKIAFLASVQHKS